MGSHIRISLGMINFQFRTMATLGVMVSIIKHCTVYDTFIIPRKVVWEYAVGTGADVELTDIGILKDYDVDNYIIHKDLVDWAPDVDAEHPHVETDYPNE